MNLLHEFIHFYIQKIFLQPGNYLSNKNILISSLDVRREDDVLHETPPGAHVNVGVPLNLSLRKMCQHKS